MGLIYGLTYTETPKNFLILIVTDVNENASTVNSVANAPTTYTCIMNYTTERMTLVCGITACKDILRTET